MSLLWGFVVVLILSGRHAAHSVFTDKASILFQSLASISEGVTKSLHRVFVVALLVIRN